jgi:hypothetical protein
MDFYKLSQEDFHVLEEKLNENKDILSKTDPVRQLIIRLYEILRNLKFPFRMIDFFSIGLAKLAASSSLTSSSKFQLLTSMPKTTLKRLP